ncbi:peptidoglycan D,D-transpeptidase FtsI family protein [Aeromicrobium fastidiosum]|uniref:Penicillin-binding protein 2 n=1 Tax=Aeromicrobium fastidiosum TaxID=52699 RepID=A0A641AR16_9ACTN|nr:penicillin-binding protein 2 [Aeromicrobium fastidiosum]KAA1380379.1 penicillin-binding protein 2 [Aeromicrobium fastidiosum]MBP2389949.1 peptidoglycan glycosyltransferase [Aeromicrobium fastidiosum]
MNRPIRNIAVACLVLFLALIINANYVQFVEADSLNSKNGNRRVINEEFSRDRGSILVDGKPVAESVKSKDEYKFQRKYPDAELYAPLTGYFSYIFGRSAVESTQNDVLSGSDDRLFVNRVVDLVSNKQPKGGSVELTIDPLAQKAASEGLERLGDETKGAVAAIDPRTGAVLAMVTQPSYDPNQLASHDFDKVQAAWKQLTGDADQPMTNRSTESTLPPGSTFKLITAAAALENGVVNNIDDKVKAGSTLKFPGYGYTLPNENGGNCGGNEITFERALNVSCNVAFGGLALEIGQEKLAAQAAKFGFGTDPISGLAASPSRFTTPDTTLEPPQLGQSGIGQYDVAATPLQMAMVAAGIANDGNVMKPYVIDTVRAPNLRVLDKTQPERLSEAVSSTTARKLREMMVSTVTQGTATSAQIPGVEVGAKTGTAQSTPDRPPYAWFVSYAKDGDKEVAVAVLVESSDTARDEIAGGRLAGPIAKSVMQAVLGS